MRKWLAALDMSDLFALAGFGALEYGVSRWSVPAAWVVGGVVLIGMSVIAARPPKKPPV